ncbi:MAG: formate dehydrogenase accessory sulfurtransferase FdhD [Geminicoccaceae bacterium]
MIAQRTSATRGRRSAPSRLAPRPVATRPASRWSDGASAPLALVETVATECPVALVYNEVSHAVMMASPADLEDMGTGFTLAENIAGLAEIGAVEVLDMVLGFEVRIAIPAERAAALEQRRRSMAGGTACGLCGVISLEQAVRRLPRVENVMRWRAGAIRAAMANLPPWQSVHRQTGAVHAAALASPSGEILLAREDVGRHNALDKLIGAAARAGLDPAETLVLLTSRCSTEMVQKAATAGYSTMVTISGPTSLAIELAEEAGMSLVAFARGDQFTVYTHPDRIVP